MIEVMENTPLIFGVYAVVLAIVVFVLIGIAIMFYNRSSKRKNNQA